MMRHRSRSPANANEIRKELPWNAAAADADAPVADDPVDSAIRALPTNTARRLNKLFSDGAMRKNDLDVKSVMILAALQEPLQQKVMGHLEAERVFLSNSRSKAGFLVSACEKAKQGALDVRGFGAIDPWKAHLNTKSLGKRTSSMAAAINLENEMEFLDRVGDTALCLIVVNCEKDEGSAQPTITLNVPWTTLVGEVKAQLSQQGVTLTPNKIKLKDSILGFLKDKYTLAYYNLAKGTTLVLEKKDRGGVRFKKDQSMAK
eukprot:GEMP01062763.1.p1 GENE.GEMP01062763.1~~GEMP01062763.1.p1  ORF type:complete len:261 (+),score=59.77 GEMP01062763.1:70-852(+)